jgi:glycosyltransferase involved in cell wall biosynthesis
LGVAAERIDWSPYSVDSEQIEKQVVEWLPYRQDLRAALGIGSDDIALIFSGKLIPKKHTLLIPEAVRLLPGELRCRFHLIVIGDGQQKRELERIGLEILGPRLHMPGFVNQSEMGRWYAAADCLVLPSQKGAGETWGLVVNEALQFGLPVVVSDGVGCHHDLIDSNTGRVFRSGSPDDLTRALVEVRENLFSKKIPCAHSCRQKAEQFSLTAAEHGLAIALHQAVGNRSAIAQA